MRVHILGFGAVAQSMVRMILRRGTMAIGDIYAVDRSEAAAAAFMALGGSRDAFRRMEIRRDNLEEVFVGIEPGDIVFTLGDMLGTRILYEYCADAGIRYLSASWDDFPNGALSTASFTVNEYRAQRRLFDASRRSAPSTIVGAGMNPGAVSLFVKRAIRELAGHSVSDYAMAAMALGVESVDVTDIDDTEVGFERQPGIVYSTWSPTEFFNEVSINSVHIQGCGVPNRYDFGPTAYEEPRTGFVANRKRACNCHATALGLDRNGQLATFVGDVVTHEEIVSIASFLSVGERGNTTVYRPETSFIYKASPIATASLRDVVASGRGPTGYHLIGADEIVAGGESVGVVVSGSRCGEVYVGTRYDIGKIPAGETPTVLQVASGCYAALCMVMRHPAMGPHFPEELDDDEFIELSGLPLTVIRTK